MSWISLLLFLISLFVVQLSMIWMCVFLLLWHNYITWVFKHYRRHIFPDHCGIHSWHLPRNLSLFIHSPLGRFILILSACSYWCRIENLHLRRQLKFIDIAFQTTFLFPLHRCVRQAQRSCGTFPRDTHDVRNTQSSEFAGDVGDGTARIREFSKLCCSFMLSQSRESFTSWLFEFLQIFMKN